MTNPHDKAIEAAAEALLAAEWEDAGETPEDAAMIARSIMGGIADDSDDYARVARLATRAAIAAYERAMWRPIEECPEEWKDGRKLFARYDHDADPYQDPHKPETLTDYAAWSEGGEFLDGKGECVVVWNGPHWESQDEYGSGYWMPAWWFAWHNGDCEFVVNPTHVRPLPTPPEMRRALGLDLSKRMK